ncbi:MinD/ParA family protein [Mangrovibacillus cuniculi]|uniref:MinD/ParA family protein n=1 Tax=Mangrovibacillus cuniculi TaxID=2593652 RepID=A0A7S8CAS0_9BACI|nr:MinD/ParA family protein [Mangrovibacillus cuniculi]QPC46363.1 MinD/ParA family protein [Mangrovibacillus cuniculi]
MDQASKLRAQVQRSETNNQSSCRTIAVVSGKGGVGKSNITLNLAVSLATNHQKKVLILDLDFGMSNLHLLLGKSPNYSLVDCLQYGISIEKAIMEGLNGLHYMSGGNGLTDIFEFSLDMRKRLIDELENFAYIYDFILLDMGAGATEQTMAFLSTAEELLVITTPEPTAMTDAYSMMKFLHLRYENRPFYLICNRAFSVNEGKEAMDRLVSTVKQFLKKDILPLGIVLESTQLRQAVINQEPVTLKYPKDEITRTFSQLAEKITVRSFENNIERSSTLSFFQKLRKRLLER